MDICTAIRLDSTNTQLLDGRRSYSGWCNPHPGVSLFDVEINVLCHLVLNAPRPAYQFLTAWLQRPLKRNYVKDLLSIIWCLAVHTNRSEVKLQLKSAV